MSTSDKQKAVAAKALNDKGSEEKEDTGPKKVLYQLTMPFWDGRKRHEAGTQIYFIEGTAPKGSTPVEPEPEDEADEPDEDKS